MKRILASILTGMLIATSITGCGDKKTEQAITEPANTADVIEKPDDTELIDEPVMESADDDFDEMQYWRVLIDKDKLANLKLQDIDAFNEYILSDLSSEFPTQNDIRVSYEAIPDVSYPKINFDVINYTDKDIEFDLPIFAVNGRMIKNVLTYEEDCQRASLDDVIEGGESKSSAFKLQWDGDNNQNVPIQSMQLQLRAVDVNTGENVYETDIINLTNVDTKDIEPGLVLDEKAGAKVILHQVYRYDDEYRDMIPNDVFEPSDMRDLEFKNELGIVNTTDETIMIKVMYGGTEEEKKFDGYYAIFPGCEWMYSDLFLRLMYKDAIQISVVDKNFKEVADLNTTVTAQNISDLIERNGTPDPELQRFFDLASTDVMECAKYAVSEEFITYAENHSWRWNFPTYTLKASVNDELGAVTLHIYPNEGNTKSIKEATTSLEYISGVEVMPYGKTVDGKKMMLYAWCSEMDNQRAEYIDVDGVAHNIDSYNENNRATELGVFGTEETAEVSTEETPESENTEDKDTEASDSERTIFINGVDYTLDQVVWIDGQAFPKIDHDTE